MPANTTITYDGYDLSDLATYLPRVAEHESSPDRDLNMIKIARYDGAKLISSWFKEKYITIPGAIQAADQASLEAKIDELKEVIARQYKDLVISWDGTTRVYQATSGKIGLIRTSDMRDWCEFVLTFAVPSGRGLAPTQTTIAVAGITTPTSSGTPTIEGTAFAEPVLTFTVNSETALTAISFEFTDSAGNSTTIAVATGFNAGDVLEIDYEAFTVKINGVEVDYSGAWGLWQPGASSYTITFTSSAHNVDFDIEYYAQYL